MEGSIFFRWLGVGGFELKSPGYTLLIDPYLSRISGWTFLVGSVRPQQDAIQKHISDCDAILVTHSHFDHVMDVPWIANSTGAKIYGSPNTCRLAEISGVARGQIQEIQAGDHMELNGFRIRVLPAVHAKMPLYPPRPLSSDLKIPLKALGYRMDRIYSFHISFADRSLLINPGYMNGTVVAADILLMHPYFKEPHELLLLGEMGPRVVIPIHWDNHHRPLSKPVSPWFRPPEVSVRPLKRYNLSEFQKQIEKKYSDIRFFLPEILKPYDLKDLFD